MVLADLVPSEYDTIIIIIRKRRNFKPQSNEEDYTSAGAPLSNFSYHYNVRSLVLIMLQEFLIVIKNRTPYLIGLRQPQLATMATRLLLPHKFPRKNSRLNNAFRFVEWAQNEIAVVPDFHKRILFSHEAHFWLNGYVNKQNCRIWSEANPQVYVETPLHPEKLTVWCALWSGRILLQKR
ncbi:DUF4817 domain-containing protein [Trichonephila clavipes]|nr:DUF4817 domain-containing protein [Trichonephila clavipes]